jgi:hypothetical protein
VAVAWFTAGIISPLFIKPENLIKTLVLAGVATLMTGFLLMWSLLLVKTIKI